MVTRLAQPDNSTQTSSTDAYATGTSSVGVPEHLARRQLRRRRNPDLRKTTPDAMFRHPHGAGLTEKDEVMDGQQR